MNIVLSILLFSFCLTGVVFSLLFFSKVYEEFDIAKGNFKNRHIELGISKTLTVLFFLLAGINILSISIYGFTCL